MAVRRISLGKAVLELDTDLDPFLKGLDTAGQKTKQFGAQASVLGSTMASVFGGVTLASLAANVVSFGANLLRSAGALQDLNGAIGYCSKTFALVPAGQDVSDLYTNPSRDKTLIAVVAEFAGLRRIYPERQHRHCYVEPESCGVGNHHGFTSMRTSRFS